MAKRKKKKQQQRPILIQQTTKQLPSPSPSQDKGIWKKIPRWLWTVFSILVAMAGLSALYPSLSINEDYSFDMMFPYNTSFSITDEGFWPITNLSVVCSADFKMLPWTSNPSDKSSMNLHTQSSEYNDFPKMLVYKHRVTLPCNHNVIANGHRIAPGAELHIRTTYRLAGTDLAFHKTFDFRTVEGWHGQQFWQYQ